MGEGEGEGQGGAGALEGAYAVESNQMLRFRTSDHLHRRSVVKPFAIIYHPPHARRAGFSCAAACNVGVASIQAFLRHKFDHPLPIKVLHASAGVAALAVHHTSIRPLLLRRFEKTVDESSIDTCSAADEHGSCARVVI